MYSLNRTKYLEPHELSHLMQRLEKSFSRDSTLILLALKTGARAQEILNIEQPDLSDTYKTVLIKGLKNSNDREIPLQPDVYARVKRLCFENPRVFPISYSRLVQIWQLHRPCNKKFHSLRHTFAIELYKRTRDIRLVQVALGHRNISNTMIYADYIFKTEELRKLIL